MHPGTLSTAAMNSCAFCEQVEDGNSEPGGSEGCVASPRVPGDGRIDASERPKGLHNPTFKRAARAFVYGYQYLLK